MNKSKNESKKVSAGQNVRIDRCYGAIEDDSNSTYCEDCGCRITAGRCKHGVMPPNASAGQNMRTYTVWLPSGKTIETDKPCVAIPFIESDMQRYMKQALQEPAL